MDFVIAGIVLAHHIYIHSDYDFPDRAFQVSDVQNHETWVIASLALATGAYFATNEKPAEKK